jgi:hypothetical protein
VPLNYIFWDKSSKSKNGFLHFEDCVTANSMKFCFSQPFNFSKFAGCGKLQKLTAHEYFGIYGMGTSKQ